MSHLLLPTNGGNNGGNNGGLNSGGHGSAGASGGGASGNPAQQQQPPTRKRTSTYIWKSKEASAPSPTPVFEEYKKPELALIKIEELQLMEAIGSGAFGQVYKARYKDKYVAVKFGDGSKKKDFAHELELLSSVSHPNIVELYGASAGTRFFLVMELGVTNLANYYKTREYDMKELMNWTMQIAEASRSLFF